MNAPASARSADFDNLLNPANLQDPFPLYAWLREEDPVHWNKHFGTWLLTRYSDVHSAFAAVFIRGGAGNDFLHR